MARREPRAESPLHVLLEKIDAIGVPPKPEPLLRAEAELRSALAERKTANAELTELCAAWRRHEDGNASVTAKPTQAALRQAERKLASADERLAHCREVAREAAQPWRAAYSRSIQEQVEPLRTMLHSKVGEIDLAIQCLAKLATRLAVVDVGSPWLVRNAAGLIANLRQVRDTLRLDEQLP